MEKDFLKRLIVLAFCIGATCSGYAQGVWDMRYIPIDSLNNTWTGKEIRIDFKSSQYDTITGEVNSFKIRNLLSKKDTVTLKIDERKVNFIEDWKFYVDHGTINDQTLSEVDENLLIGETYIVSVIDSVLVVKMNFYKTKNCNPLKMIFSDNKIVTIPKEVIKGVLYRQED